MRKVWSCILFSLIICKICWSFAETQTLSSITNKRRSEFLMIFSIKGISSLKSPSPGLSKKVIFQRLSTSKVWEIISMVVPWISVTIALNCPIRRLKSVDFPAFVAQMSPILMLFFLQINLPQYREKYGSLQEKNWRNAKKEKYSVILLTLWLESV